MNTQKRIAFTLVELVIVVLILGILATVAAGRFTKLSVSADGNAIKRNLDAIYEAMDMNSPGSPPASIEAEWFTSGRLPSHPHATAANTSIQIDATPNKTEPGYKVLKDGIACYWYNPTNGVLIARVGVDVALADFESAVIQLVSDVEQAYWQLATAYRVLEATAKGREAALQTFQYQQVRLEVGTGRADEEAQARSQYYQFEAQLQNALGGPQGVYALEQQLRYLIGKPATDGSLIKPTTDPSSTKVVFDWESALGQSLGRRVEIRRQRFNVKRREMELTAARLNRRPRLDVVGQYRWRGLGDDLIGGGANGANDNLFDSITDGDYQEWGAGVEFSMPVGLRAASNAIAHARLNLNRERALLAETELRISHDLSSAARQIELTHQLMETNYNRYLADAHQVEVLGRRYRNEIDNINFLLQAQRQVVASEIEFYQALANYNLALRDFHTQKGSLLAYNNVQMAEGPWAAGASRDAYEAGRFLTPRFSPEKVSVPQPVTTGVFNPAEVQVTAGSVASPAFNDISETSSTMPDQNPVASIAAAPKKPSAETLSPLNLSDPKQTDFKSLLQDGQSIVR